MLAGGSGELLSLLAEQSMSAIAMAVLVVFSGLFSGSETALFSLTSYERLKLRDGAGRLGHVVDRLLGDPQNLLMTILLANMAVNILIFTVSSVIVLRLIHADHEFAASMVGVATLLTVVLFGEILPKAGAFYLRVTLSKVVAVPLWSLGRLLQPVMWVVRWVIVAPAVRVLTGGVTEQQLQRDELLQLLDTFAKEGDDRADQVDLLRNVVDLGELRVRQIMRPRVELVNFGIDGSVDELRRVADEKHVSVVLIHRRHREDVIGIVWMRRIGLEQPGSIADVVERVSFVPEQQRVDQLVHFFNDSGANAAAVIDEYGGLTGLVRMDDVVEELLGKIAREDALAAEPQLIDEGGGRYVVDGGFEMEDFCRHFKLPEPGRRVETVGGFVMDELGRLPSAGEAVRYEHLMLEVGKVMDNQIRKIIVVDQHVEGKR